MKREKSEATNGAIRWSNPLEQSVGAIRYQGGIRFFRFDFAEFLRFDLDGVFHITWGGWEGGGDPPPTTNGQPMLLMRF